MHDAHDPQIDPDDYSSNPSTSRPFSKIVEANLGRRTVLAGGVTVAAGFLTAAVASQGSAETPVHGKGHKGGHGKPGHPHHGSSEIGFEGISASKEDKVRVPDGYTAVAFLPWGTAIAGDYPSFTPGKQSAKDQTQQMGMNHDGMHYFPLDEHSKVTFPPMTAQGHCSNEHGLLVVNHEYTEENWLHSPSGAKPPKKYSEEQVKLSQAAHGVAIVEVRRKKHHKTATSDGSVASTPLGCWEIVHGKYNRRITATTPMQFSGPAAGHRLLQTPDDEKGMKPLGTMNNCSMGYTPWGTYLACEENFNGYFKVDGACSGEEKKLIDRYGVGGNRANWADTDDRFLLEPGNTHESNRFGWVVEIDPTAPKSAPVKRTALGRVKHEGATVWESKDGRIVVYTGDDQVNEYIYKYVSARPWKTMLRMGESPLDDGTLYVAKFNEDGSGEWIPLIHGKNGLTAANGFKDQGDVLVKTRFAGDTVGATPMDRPEWCTVDPTSDNVYFTLTNNKTREEANAANPRTPNKWGHIIRWCEDGGKHSATSFEWDLFLMAGPGDGKDGSTVPADAAFGSPDGLRADASGRVWIETDGSQPGKVNNQMLCADPNTLDEDGVPNIERFLTGPVGCEVTGISFTPDHRTMFVGIQHPGEDGGSEWPYGLGTKVPRASLVVITKKDGGIIGS